MDARTLGYWLTTGLFSAALGTSGLAYLSGAQPLVDAVQGTLGYPAHLMPLLGALKVLGAVALLIPGWPRLKEWAYAGFTFNLLGAAWAHLAVEGAAAAASPVVLGAVLAASYALRPEARRLPAAAEPVPA